jgi:hypothetical protein
MVRPKSTSLYREIVERNPKMFRPYPCRCVFVLLVLLGQLSAVKAWAQSNEFDRFLKAKLILCFEGKGSYVAFDAGVAAAMYRQIPALKEGNLVITASSSGVIPAIYFSTHGFNDKSLDEGLVDIICCKSTFDAIRQAEDPVRKTRSLLLGQNTELSYNVMKEVAGRILDVEDWESAKDIYEIAARSRVEFCLPVAIVAVNHEVADNAVAGSLFRGREEKEFISRNFSVAWKPSVYEFYRKDPERFVRNNPHLTLGDSPYIGKACTYFVNESMYKLLKRLPVDERLADLRLMKTPRDMALALMASIGEPTYFQPIEEIDYSLLECGDKLGSRGNSKRRLYAGGFAMPMVGQDFRRLLPHAYVLGTGSYPFSSSVRRFLRGQYIVDTKVTYALSNWWVDLHTAPRGPEWREFTYGMLSPRDELELGKERAFETFRRDNVFPGQVIKPELCHAAAEAIGKVDTSQELKTRRGLGELIQLDTSSASASQDAGAPSRTGTPARPESPLGDRSRPRG